jgi:beta-propeller repeat-containing protein
MKTFLTSPACKMMALSCSMLLVGLATMDSPAAAQPKHLTMPAIAFQTIFGGTRPTRPLAIAVDHRGNSYTAGFTEATDLPTTAGAFQTWCPTAGTGFVMKIDPNGNIVYATLLCGTLVALGIAVDADGQAYVTGQTPGGLLVRNAAQAEPGGGTDAFVTVLNADGSDVIYSTYLGGSGEDGGNALSLSQSGRVVVTGFTSSRDFPGARGSLSVSGSQDGFVVVLDDGTLEASRLIGGSGRDDVTDVAVSARGRVYLTGVTSSSDFPTFNPVQASLAGGEDAFVSVLDSSLRFRFSTFLGGQNNEAAPSIAVDSKGDAYVAGKTGAGGFPLRRPLQPLPGSSGDFFLTKIDVKKGTLVYSTYLGGSDVEDDIQIAVDHAGRAYLAGVTESPDFPEVNPIAGANSSVFQAVVSSRGDALVYSTRLPAVRGEEDVFHGGGAVAVSTTGDAYVSGWAFQAFVAHIESRKECVEGRCR